MKEIVSWSNLVIAGWTDGNRFITGVSPPHLDRPWFPFGLLSFRYRQPIIQVQNEDSEKLSPPSSFRI